MAAGRDAVADSPVASGRGGTHQTGREVAEALPVAVLLSTFDGARHLRPQLQSLAEQTYRRWCLLWRDDGSSDETTALVDAFKGELGEARCIAATVPVGHLGITGSFLALLRQVPAGHVAAFADQDDVWLPEKLARGVSALQAVPADRPALYYARQRLVDEDLSPLGLSPQPRQSAGFPAALTQNVATGCTVMLNQAAVALVAASEPPDGTLHDWWSYLLVSAAGGHLMADPVPVVLYRQHAGNAVGAPHSLLRRGVMALRRGPDAFMQLFRRHVAGLLASGAALSPEAARDLLILEEALSGGLLARLRAMRRVRSLIRRTRLETLLFRLWFLIG